MSKSVNFGVLERERLMFALQSTLYYLKCRFADGSVAEFCKRLHNPFFAAEARRAYPVGRGVFSRLRFRSPLRLGGRNGASHPSAQAPRSPQTRRKRAIMAA